MPVENNIFLFAADKVENKGFFSRIGHSARFHSLRSAVNSKGSAGSKFLKVLGAGARASFSLIPIPILGSLLQSAEQAAESKLRTWVHGRNIKDKKNYKGVLDVKFALKDISVDSLDRYRFKVTHAVDEMVAAQKDFQERRTSYTEIGMRCDAQLQFAMAIMQAQRRVTIFENAVVDLKILMIACEEWVQASKTSVTDYQNQARQAFLDMELEDKAIADGGLRSPLAKSEAERAIFMRHHSCEDFCSQRDNKVGGNLDKFRAGAAAVIRELTDPFSPETFLSANRTSFESANQVENYQPKKPS